LIWPEVYRISGGTIELDDVNEAVATQDDDPDEERNFDEIDDLDEEYSDEDNSETDSDLVDYFGDGEQITRRELREIEESLEQDAELYLQVQYDIDDIMAENGGYPPMSFDDDDIDDYDYGDYDYGDYDYDEPVPSPSPPRTTILPASHFKCSICGTQAVRRVAGPNAMPHNVGRGFYKCPNHGQYFKWEDGSLPFSETSQARFNDWMDAGFDYAY
jgi:GRF zinc finger